MSIRHFLLSLCLATLVLAPLSASAVVLQQHDHSAHQQQPLLDGVENAESSLYVCPMHPHIVQGEPGTCPICGMDLVARKNSPNRQVSISVDAGMQQQLGIRTDSVERRTFWRYYPTLATVQWNDNARYHIHPRASGWLERLAIRSEGQAVKQGELLYEIYSQELVVAQQDFLQARDAASGSQRERLLRDARMRLELLGFNATLIEQLQRSGELLYRVPVYAPVDGVVTALNVAQGMFVQPASELLTITGANQYWLIADVPERYADWLRVGAPADISLAAAELNGYESSVDYIYPELDPTSRTQRVRILLPQQAATNALAVGMQAQVELYGGPKRQALAVPLESLIVTGANNRVIVQQDNGEFVQREVHVGLIINDYAEILHGLSEGERVVSSGQFLLDSEASLRNNFSGASSGDGHAH
ncbi:efflux RND transporter periplasmic adaptor subunit [Pseudidiomarina mangrovi]|uniref:efflux RND transporter periplasmic adaptor subunit n=1 Tax=Pseudidiomarina mangrovi TaxID=2487133 RepID=UPI000FCAFD4E|nr:efflux RND transporter periplasmic adaptor subunit [Pseudidiomarina mangrovi]